MEWTDKKKDQTTEQVDRLTNDRYYITLSRHKTRWWLAITKKV